MLNRKAETRCAICFRVTPAMRAKLDAAAAKNGSSLTNEIERRLEWALAYETVEDGLRDIMAGRIKVNVADYGHIKGGGNAGPES